MFLTRLSTFWGEDRRVVHSSRFVKRCIPNIVLNLIGFRLKTLYDVLPCLCHVHLTVPTSTSHLLSGTASVEQAALSSLVPFVCCLTGATLVVTGALLLVTGASLVVTMFAIRNKCHASSNRCHASSNGWKKWKKGTLLLLAWHLLLLAWHLLLLVRPSCVGNKFDESFPSFLFACFLCYQFMSRAFSHWLCVKGSLFRTSTVLFFGHAWEECHRPSMSCHSCQLQLAFKRSRE